jgi:hypothetical protein
VSPPQGHGLDALDGEAGRAEQQESRAWVPWCGGWERRSAHGGYGDGGAARPRLERAPAMAPSAAAPAQHDPRSSSGAADVAVMVAVPPPSSSAANHHHHHHRRAGAPLSATSMVSPGTGTSTGTGTPPMDVVHHRRTSSTSSSSALPAPPQQVRCSLAHPLCPRLDPPSRRPNQSRIAVVRAAAIAGRGCLMSVAIERTHPRSLGLQLRW